MVRIRMFLSCAAGERLDAHVNPHEPKVILHVNPSKRNCCSIRFSDATLYNLLRMKTLKRERTLIFLTLEKEFGLLFIYVNTLEVEHTERAVHTKNGKCDVTGVQA